MGGIGPTCIRNAVDTAQCGRRLRAAPCIGRIHTVWGIDGQIGGPTIKFQKEEGNFGMKAGIKQLSTAALSACLLISDKAA
jgi:hypothetical protein